MNSENIVKAKPTSRFSFALKQVLWVALMFIVAGIFLVPLYWIIITSFKFEGDIPLIPPSFFPNPATIKNYSDLLDKFNFGLYFLNSMRIAVIAVIAQLLSCSLGAYAFARLRFPFKRVIFYVLLSTMMIPGQVTIIPNFIVFNTFKLVDTLFPLILPPFFGSAFGVFLIRQFFMTVPRELEEAAKLDGCSNYGVYMKIFMPIARPTLATLAIFTFMNNWNDLLGPVVYLTNPKLRTITVGLALFQDSLRVSIGTIMAGALLSIIPLLVMYIFAQRYFVKGMITSGFKG